MNTECWDLFWLVPLTRFPSYPSVYYSLLLNYQSRSTGLISSLNTSFVTWIMVDGNIPTSKRSIFDMEEWLWFNPAENFVIMIYVSGAFESSLREAWDVQLEHRGHTVLLWVWSGVKLLWWYVIHYYHVRIKFSTLNDAFYLKCYLVCACRVY